MWEALLAITGSLLFGCASEPATGELYFKDDAGHVHQLTVTEPKQGAWDAAWQGERFVAVIDRGFRKGKHVDLIVRRRGDRRRVVGSAYLVQQLYWISRHRLVALTESRSGQLVNPRTGAVQRLGELPCGYFTSAVWTRRGEHPWPPPR